MKSDTLKLVATYLIAVLVIAFGYYSLVLYPYQLDDLVKGAIIGFMSTAIVYVFSDQAATRNARQQEKAFDQGLMATPTITTDAGPPPSVTVEPSGGKG
jgi:hypothetical protein